MANCSFNIDEAFIDIDVSIFSCSALQAGTQTTALKSSVKRRKQHSRWEHRSFSPGTLADLQLFNFNKTISTSADDGYTVVGEALKSKTTNLSVVENTRGATGTDEIQHVVNVTAAVLADMANSTVSLSDGAGSTVTTTFTAAPANIDALRDALTTAITAHDADASNTDFELAITDGLTGTDLVMTFDGTNATGKNVVPASSLTSPLA